MVTDQTWGDIIKFLDSTFFMIQAFPCYFMLPPSIYSPCNLTMSPAFKPMLAAFADVLCSELYKCMPWLVSTHGDFTKSPSHLCQIEFQKQKSYRALNLGSTDSMHQKSCPFWTEIPTQGRATGTMLWWRNSSPMCHSSRHLHYKTA